jgi:hypothetical protein
MFSFLKKKKVSSGPSPVLVYAHINAKLMPRERGERFEEPLAGVLERAGMGSITGAGTMLTQEKEIEYCGIDVDVAPADLERAVPLIASTLERQGGQRGRAWSSSGRASLRACRSGRTRPSRCT